MTAQLLIEQSQNNNDVYYKNIYSEQGKLYN